MPAAAIKMQPTEASSSCLPAGAPHILVVDDDREMCEMVQVALGQRGYSATWRLTPDDALAELEVTEYSALLVDVHMQGKSGLDLCRHALTKRPEMPVIVMTGFGTMNDAVGAIRAGAYDFVTKPASMDALALTLERAIQHRSLTKELRRLRSRVETQELPSAFGASDAMQRVSELISRVAESDTSVLITGESGTGKELVARALHERSHRAGPFLAINCAAVPETLLESELFGYVRGAFTDARADRAGLFVEANGGTLFLDEIGEMPLSMQTKLLRALQERKVRPVGSSREVPFSARIVTATNRDLEAEVAAKRFREDLFYRVNVVRVDVPPLRERGGDPLELAQLFLSRAAKRTSRDSLRIDPAAAQLLLTYDWPGNVRELENVIERAAVLCRSEALGLSDLPDAVAQAAAAPPSAVQFPIGTPLEEVERRLIRDTLAHTGGDKSLAAQLLGISTRTIYRKLGETE